MNMDKTVMTLVFAATLLGAVSNGEAADAEASGLANVKQFTLEHNHQLVVQAELLEVAVAESLERVAIILAEMKVLIERKGEAATMLLLANEAQVLIADAYGKNLTDGGYEAALSLLPEILDEILLVVESGDWEGGGAQTAGSICAFRPGYRTTSYAARARPCFEDGGRFLGGQRLSTRTWEPHR
ncbi:hypothetical protein AC244_32625 [Ensifer adhaerens]|uniref:Uncharacterized protein n=1 Tax=Ensifer adhaerens TaxID=106592 RepID=A0A0L8BED5_ENSAD|nr:hypothetical protein [Ensifer adhaerens]KOF12978.1 hypothetical protein AC244_32625 [Ensifer adhaerens]